jgi:DNA-binding GntR family transcriptional regulator
LSAELKGLEVITAPASLKNMALKAIKEAIWADVLHSGSVYSEPQLAQKLGISRTPIREALLELAGQGFLTFIPRRGFRIKRLSVEEVHHLFTFRRAIELTVVTEIMPRINEHDIKRIDDIHCRDNAAARADSKSEFIRVDREFHTFLASLTKNQYLIAALENVRDLIDWVGAKVLERSERRREVIREHGAIVLKIHERNLAAALQAMEEHINITEKLITDHLGADKNI